MKMTKLLLGVVIGLVLLWIALMVADEIRHGGDSNLNPGLILLIVVLMCFCFVLYKSNHSR